MKIAKWEFMRNIKSKSFLISLVLTPLIFIVFATAPTLLSNWSADGGGDTQVYLNDELGVYEGYGDQLRDEGVLEWDIEMTDASADEMQGQLEDEENAAYVAFNEETLENGTVTYVTGEDVGGDFQNDLRMFEQPIKQLQLDQAGLSDEQMSVVANPIQFEEMQLEEASGEGTASAEGTPAGFFEDPFEGGIPAIFAGVILFSIVLTGMMIFQSASQEKKEKVAEIILSSVTPNELMQGKIIGYFGLGLFQVGIWLTVAIPLAIWRLEDVPVLEYLLVPETLLLVVIAILGYLLFASLFVGLGATLEDASSSGNFQGMVLMLPFIPFILIGPILIDPNGIIAVVASYVPFTAPATLILRLAMLEEWPWMEIFISLAILIASIWIVMKLAGKIFKVGILIYGKNATPQEIIKWLRA